MSKDNKGFSSIIQMVETFSTEEKCINYFEELRWAGKPHCPYCNNDKVYKFASGKKYKCAACKLVYSIRVGTIFEGSNLPLQKWFMALYLLVAHKKGISSHQLGRDIGVTQKSAWFMLHRLRHALEQGNFNKPLTGVVEADETYIGGIEKNRHASKRKDGRPGMGSIGRRTEDKTVVFGAVERKGDVVVKQIASARKEAVEPIIIKHVTPGAKLMTDEWYGYNGMGALYNHQTIKHILKKYVVGEIHTNTIENFWSVLKRGLYGIYHQVDRFHLQKYLDEFAFRFNYRKQPQEVRFNMLLCSGTGIKMPYKQLIKRKDSKYL